MAPVLNPLVPCYVVQVNELNKGGPSKVSPLAIPMLLGNMISGIIAIELGALGPNFGTCEKKIDIKINREKRIKSGDTATCLYICQVEGV
jgi:hypothetical protein